MGLKPPDPPPTDGVIVLRLQQETDVAAIAQATHDPETQRRLEDAPMTPERSTGSVSRAQERWRTGAGAPFVIADAEDDRPVGLVNLQFGDDDGVAGLAVSVFPDARGRGLAARALRLAALWGLRELGLARVFAEAAADNEASIRSIENAGFQREGTLRAHCSTHGQRHDCVMFSMVPGDMQAQ
jgi:RimJ/RimL family protein N-acetyltransferase